MVVECHGPVAAAAMRGKILAVQVLAVSTAEARFDFAHSNF